MARYIIRRSSTLYFRRAIPDALRSGLGRRELVRTLATTDIRTAKLRAGRLYVLSEALFEAVVDNPMLTPDQLARLVQDFYSYVLERENEFRLGLKKSALMPLGMPAEVGEKRRAFYAEVAQRSRESLASNRFQDAALISAAMGKKHQLGDLDAPTRNQVAQAVLRAGIELSEALAARYAGDFSFEPKDPLLKRQIESLDHRAEHVHAGPEKSRPGEQLDLRNDRAPTSHARSGEPLLSEVQEGFRSEQLSARSWDKQSAAQAGASYRLFVEVCGDRPLRDYSRRDVGRFKDLASRLPADYGKAALFRGQTVESILKIHASQPIAKRSSTISQKTIKRHFSALSQLWAAALPRGQVSENIFLGFSFGAAKRAVEQRAMWTSQDLEELFATPQWSGCLSESRRSSPGALIIRDEKFWLPLIALFSGMRQEEICQLHLEDIKEEDEIPFFDLNARPPRRLKNANAIRKVPIHSELNKLGLAKYVSDQRRLRRLRLFENLSPGGADERLGHAFTKWFTRYRRDVGLYRPGLDFHSFRHTATTLLHQAGVQDSIIDRLTGHSTPGETARYTKSTSLTQLRDAVERIPTVVDLSRLYIA